MSPGIPRVGNAVSASAIGDEPVASRRRALNSFRPDVVVGRFEANTEGPQVPRATAPAATLEPRFIEILDRDPEEVRVTSVEIRALPDLELVTAIEILSPFAQVGPESSRVPGEARHASRAARKSVEIDLLLVGAPLPMKERIEPRAYHAIVARGARLPLAEVYRWTVRDPLPSAPISIREPDGDILVDLAVLVNRVYDLGRYARTLKHGTPAPETTSLTPEDRAWVGPQSWAGKTAPHTH